MVSEWKWRRKVIKFENGYVTLSPIDDAIMELGPCPRSEYPRVYANPASGLWDLAGVWTGPVQMSGPGCREPATVVRGQLWIRRHDLPMGQVVVLVPVGDPVASGGPP